jgi:hypothetical protein
MKIKVRRKVANGLVIGLQLGVIAPMVANSSIEKIETADAAASLDGFVAMQPPSTLHGLNDSMLLAQAQDKPVEDDPTGGDPSATGNETKTHDPSAIFGPSDTIELPDSKADSREQVTEPPDSE